MDAGEFVFNGIDGLTGAYLVPRMNAAQVRQLASGEIADEQHLKELQSSYQRATEATFGPTEGVDPTNLAESGWGIVFAHGADPSVREALVPLIDHRRRQATALNERRSTAFPGGLGSDPLARATGLSLVLSAVSGFVSVVPVMSVLVIAAVAVVVARSTRAATNSVSVCENEPANAPAKNVTIPAR